MGIIKKFFATPVYLELDYRCIEICRTWFEQAQPYMALSDARVSNVPYASTLAVPQPGKSKVYWDPMSTATWDQFNSVMCEHVTNWLFENKYHYYKPRIVNCWLNDIPSGAQIQMHTHYGYSLSGVFYVNVPENAWVLKFQRPVTSYFHRLTKISEFTEDNSDAWAFRVDTGNVVIFPSELVHGVPTMPFEGRRLSVNFDIILEETSEMFPVVEQAIAKNNWAVPKS